MIKLCTDPNCDEEAGLTIQRQIDPAPVPYCHPHGAQRQHELQQALENFRVVVIPPAAPPTELDRAVARIHDLEDLITKATGNAHGLLQPGATEQAEQLATALHTHETQSRALSSARSELADREQALQRMRRDLEQTRAELERTSAELVTARRTLQTRTPAPAPTVPPPAPITPPPPTRPDANKP